MIFPGESPSPDDWLALSALPAKRAAFAADLYFRECWSDCRAVFGARTLAVLHSLAILCAKPDAVVGRRLGPMLDYAIDRGFAPLAAARFHFTRHAMREIWRYDWHVYPVDRLQFCTVWYSANGTMLFALHDKVRDSALPASVRLGALKGDALAERRSPDELRSRLLPPNRILNFVHVPDEPADVVRELGILFDSRERLALLHEIDRQKSHEREARALIAGLESAHAPHELDIRKVMRRLSGLPDASAAAITVLREAIASCRKLSWDTLCALQPPDAPGLARWDFIVLASSVIEPEREVDAPLMPAASAADWQAKAGSGDEGLIRINHSRSRQA